MGTTAATAAGVGCVGWVMREQLDATFSETNVGICWAVNKAAQLADHDLSST